MAWNCDIDYDGHIGMITNGIQIEYLMSMIKALNIDVKVVALMVIG